MVNLSVKLVGLRPPTGLRNELITVEVFSIFRQVFRLMDTDCVTSTASSRKESKTDGNSKSPMNGSAMGIHGKRPDPIS